MDVDTIETSDRVAIQALYKRLAIAPTISSTEFGCTHLDNCSRRCREGGRRFHTGTWPYVGAHYGSATVDGYIARILFVAMERGGRHDPAEELAFADTQWAFRTSMEERKNPHMGGVAEIIHCSSRSRTR
jgi:hypothetical protein